MHWHLIPRVRTSFHACILHCHSLCWSDDWTFTSGVAKKCHQLDYIGISIFLSGCFIPPIIYGFYCSPWRYFYLGLITTAASTTIYITLSPLTCTPAYRRFRAYMFIGLGMSVVIPLTHGIVLYGFDKAYNLFSLNWLAVSGVLNIVGALLYVERCPERFCRGRFDMIVCYSWFVLLLWDDVELFLENRVHLINCFILLGSWPRGLSTLQLVKHLDIDMEKWKEYVRPDLPPGLQFFVVPIELIISQIDGSASHLSFPKATPCPTQSPGWVCGHCTNWEHA